MSTTIEERFVAALNADVELSAIIGDRLYPGVIPDDETNPPWLFFAVPESVPFDQLDLVNTPVRSQCEFHALTDSFGSAKAIIARVAAVLKGMAADGMITGARWTGTSQDTPEEGYHHTIRFDVDWVEG